MAADKRRKFTGRRTGAPFLRLPHPVIDSPNFPKLTGSALRLLIDLGRQYRGTNNGDLCATLKVLAARGWTSNSQLTEAIRELEHYGFIVRTRQGGRNLCSLFALTWQAIDECGGKLDIPATKTAPATYKAERKKFRSPKKKGRRRWSGPGTGGIPAPDSGVTCTE